MKRFISCALALVLMLLPHSGMLAQALAFRLDAEGNLSFRETPVAIKDAGNVIESDLGNPQGIFLYVRHDTPIGPVMDFIAVAKKVCTYPVAVVNPLNHNDRGRTYGPHALRFTDEPRGRAGLKSRKDDASVSRLMPEMTVGTIFSDFDAAGTEGEAAKKQIYHTDKSALAPARDFTVVDVDVADFGLYTKEHTDVDEPLEYSCAKGTGDLQFFLENLISFKNVSELPGGREYTPGKGCAVAEFTVNPLGSIEDVRIVRPSGLAGLDEVITGALRESMPYWTPPTTGGKPCYARVTVPVQGEIASRLASLVSCSPAPRYANRAEGLLAQIHDPDSRYVLVACHRGDWRNYPENSIPAIESVIRKEADIVEIDIHMTADSVLVLCHDNNVRRTTNFSKVFKDEKDKSAKIADLTLDEIKRLSLKRAHGVAIDTLRMPTLEEALLCAKDRILVNIDKGYDYYDEVLKLTEKLGVTDQVLIKSKNPIDVVAEHEAPYSHNVMYMPIVDIQKEKGIALFNSYIDRGVVPLAYEVCWSRNGDGLFLEVCRKILAQGSRIWVNTIWASLCGGDGNDDDAAFECKDPGEVYQQYLDAGVSMFQTDRPDLIIGWLKEQGRHSL